MSCDSCHYSSSIMFSLNSCDH